MPEPIKIVAPLFLAVQALLVYWLGNREQPPTLPDVKYFATQFGGWKQAYENTIAEDVRTELKADQFMDRTYVNRTGAQAELLVSWYASQRRGDRQPHSPEVCLPGSGWIPESSEEVSFNSAPDNVTATRYFVSKGAARIAILYWYQTPRRAVSSEWTAKLWVAADAIRDRRTDTALVRISVPAAGRQYDAAAAEATQFAREVYPWLRGYLGLRRQ